MKNGETIWAIYHDHWAKESNRIRFFQYRKQSWFKTLEGLHSWVSFSTPLKINERNVESIEKELVEGLPNLFNLLFTKNSPPIHYIYIMKELSGYICSSHLMDDEDIFRGNLCCLLMDPELYFLERMEKKTHH